MKNPNFSDNHRFDYEIFGNASGIIRSVGVDGDADFPIENIEMNDSDNAETILQKYSDSIYDPTNGIVSNGDIIRIIDGK